MVSARRGRAEQFWKGSPPNLREANFLLLSAYCMAQTNSPLGEWLQKGGKILPFSVPSPLQKWRSVKSGQSFVRSINFVPL